MPWTIEDVERHKAGLTDAQKRQWVRIANSALASCLASDGSQETCDHANTYEIRRETHQGRTHIIVPVIMLKDGVHNGSRGPLLHLSEEYGRVLDAWNGIPVTLSHPKNANGELVPANSPEMIDNDSVGRVYHTSLNGGLRAELWIDEQTCAEKSPETLQYINERRPIDVSVGVFSDEEETPGQWNGEAYNAIARNHRPDHLALLPGETGACSWGDGCGIRANQAGGGEKVKNDKSQSTPLIYLGAESIEWSKPILSDFNADGNWILLSQTERAKIASHYLIGNAGTEAFEDLKLPVVNSSTSKLNENALKAVIGGRGMQVNGVSAEEMSKAKCRAYSLLNSKFDVDLTLPENLTAYALGFKEICNQMRSQLDAMDDHIHTYYLEDAFADNTFIYEVRGGANPGFYQRDYQLNEDGSVEFTGEPVKVTVTKEYTPIQGNSQTKGGLNVMGNKECKNCPEQVKLIIQSKLTRFEESDREYLEGLEEVTLLKLLPLEQENPAAPQVNKEQIAEVVKEQFNTMDKFLGLATQDLRDQLSYGRDRYQADRKAFVDKIVANSDFEEADLEKESMARLQKLSSIIKAPDFSGNGAGNGVQTNVQEAPVLAPVGVTAEEKK
ncbi:MAG: hypothetical protein ACYSSI_08840 [Planctomycetota bacterium]|jgi:hypothetical protein